MSGENPYAPPQTTSAGVPDAPESFGWKLIGNRIWVEKFAQFPMVDPYSGESDEVMTMTRITLRQRPIWLVVLRWILVCVIFLPAAPLIDPDLKTTISFIGIAGFAITLIASMFLPLVGLKVFFTSRTLRSRTIQHWTISALFLVGIISGIQFGNSGLPSSHPLLDGIPVIAFGLWFLGLIWKNLIQRRLTCRRRKDGRFEIRGIHPKALDQLKASG